MKRKDLEIKFQLAEKTLYEVMHQTEYQDEKASRILLVMSFLTAFSGIIFRVYLDVTKNYNHTSLEGWRSLPGCGLNYELMTIVSPWIFFLYAFFLTLGAGLILWAIKPQFNLHPSWKSKPSSSDPPRSFLFFLMIKDLNSNRKCNFMNCLSWQAAVAVLPFSNITHQRSTTYELHAAYRGTSYRNLCAKESGI